MRKYKFYYIYSKSKEMLRFWNMKGNKNRSPVATVLDSQRDRQTDTHMLGGGGQRSGVSYSITDL